MLNPVTVAISLLSLTTAILYHITPFRVNITVACLMLRKHKVHRNDPIHASNLNVAYSFQFNQCFVRKQCVGLKHVLLFSEP